jgi:glycosyltransferase involved in cell wall biosynthesis
MKKKPVIMQIIPELGAGGAEQGCIDVAAEIIRSGAVALVVSHGGARVGELARSGAEHINLPVHSKNPLTMWINALRLRHIIRKRGVDIVHARSRAPAWSGWLACKNTAARFMTTCHAPYKIHNDTKRFYNSSIAKGERVIAISNFVANYLKNNYQIDPQVIRVVQRGISLERFHPTAVMPERMISVARDWRIPDGANVILMPARLTRWKGHHILIDAIAALKRDDVFCVMIGDDQGRSAYRIELEDTIRMKKLEGKVRIVDHCKDMPAAYMLSAAVVSASIEPEGFGRVPIEAQAMGRPIIATDHGGAQETIVRGETGWLVPPSSAKALATAINEALNLTPDQRDMLAAYSMDHIARNFTKEKMVSETMDVYMELLDERGAARHLSRQRAYAAHGETITTSDRLSDGRSEPRPDHHHAG